MKEEQNYGKRAYKMSLEFEEGFENSGQILQDVKNQSNTTAQNLSLVQTSVDSLETNVSSLQSNVSTLETNIDSIESDVSIIETDIETIQQNVSDLQTQLSSNSSGVTLTKRDYGSLYIFESEEICYAYLGEFSCDNDCVGVLTIDFDVCNTTSGQTGSCDLKIFVNDELSFQEEISFGDIAVKRHHSIYFFGSSTPQSVYMQGECLSSGISCEIKNIKLCLLAQKPVLIDNAYAEIGEEIPSNSGTYPGNLYVISCDGIGYHAREYASGSTTSTSLDEDTPSVFGLTNSTKIIDMKSSLIVVISAGKKMAYPSFCRLQEDGIVVSASAPAASCYVLNSLGSSPKFKFMSPLEFYNQNSRGKTGINNSILNVFGVLLGGFDENNVFYVIGGNISFNTTNTVPSEVTATVSNVQDLSSVSNIYGNSFNYAAMVIFEDTDSKLYFQPYKDNQTTSATDFLTAEGDPVEIGVGNTCTAYYDEGEIRFYYHRDGKIYNTTLDLSTGQKSSEVFVTSGEYYKETDTGFIMRNTNGVFSYVKK